MVLFTVPLMTYGMLFFYFLPQPLVIVLLVVRWLSIIFLDQVVAFAFRDAELFVGCFETSELFDLFHKKTIIVVRVQATTDLGFFLRTGI